RPRPAPRDRSRDRRSGRRVLAHRDRGRGVVPGRQHRLVRVDHPWRRGTGLAGGSPSAGAAGRPGRTGDNGGRLAGGPRGGGSWVRTLAAISSNSQALWYLTRGFGLIALVLLTLTMVMGLLQVVRFARPGLPRFVVAGLHRNVSLLAVALLAVHIVTAVLDS